MNNEINKTKVTYKEEFDKTFNIFIAGWLKDPKNIEKLHLLRGVEKERRQAKVYFRLMKMTEKYLLAHGDELSPEKGVELCERYIVMNDYLERTRERHAARVTALKALN